MHDETERAGPESEAAAPAAEADGPGDAGTPEAGDGGGEGEAAAVTDEPCGPEAGEEEADEGGDDALDGEAALKDQLLRALADAENARRRARKDVEDARTYAISRFAQDLLGVADNLARALDSIPAERREGDDAVKAIAEGVEMTAREFEAALARHGITRIDPLGEKFDYNLHQALFETADTDQPDGTVVQVLQTGYRIGDRLLREAMVGVAKGGTAPAEEGATPVRRTRPPRTRPPRSPHEPPRASPAPPSRLAARDSAPILNAGPGCRPSRRARRNSGMGHAARRMQHETRGTRRCMTWSLGPADDRDET